MHINQGPLHRYVSALWEAKGTDLLLTVESRPFIRVDGELRRLDDEAELTEEDIGLVIVGVLTEEQMREFEHRRDTDFAVSFEDKARLRGSAYMQRGNPALALRLIPDRIPSFDELGLSAAVRDLATLAQGLVLFTGPTGSGKSTSQAAVVDWINHNRRCHILTIEDPIEYLHRHAQSAVSQREVGTDSDSFARALRSALREDPDVILLGEMRDPESIAIALTLAETGHLVISTLHTNDAAQALDRIVDVFEAERQEQIRVQLSSALAAVVAQRLLPRIGGGLVAAYEVLIASHAVRNLIREGKTRQIRNVITTGQGVGMQTLEAGLSRLVLERVVTYEDAVARALVPNEVATAPPVVRNDVMASLPPPLE
ncbi:MAG: PilT/PilU family type 4a pilus ATPase [Acidimicrobiales bacterium]